MSWGPGWVGGDASYAPRSMPDDAVYFRDKERHPTTAYLAECADCGWTDRTADRAVTETAAEVHGRLRPGHTATVTEDGVWIR